MTLEQLLASDSILPHEKPPHGVPTSFDWQAGPVQHAGGDPGGREYFNPWGQVYWPADAVNFNNYGCRVEVRELKSWLLLKSTLAWIPAYSSGPALTGSWYNEDFTGGSLGQSNSTARPGSILTYVPEGRLFHFYPNTARAHIDPDDVVGVAVTCRARLTLIGVQDGLHEPEWYVNVGADYWPEPTGGNVHGVGQGRLKRLMPDYGPGGGWRVYGYTSCPAVPLLDQSSPEWF